MRRPSNNSITLKFGATSSPYSPSNPHKGVDFSYQPNNKIYAPFAGRVSQVANNGKDGNGTYMTDSKGRFHGLLHASKYLVPNGSIVSEGQEIAIMGDSGFAQGVHLHWAVKENGIFIDPLSILKEEEIVITKEQEQVCAIMATGSLPGSGYNYRFTGTTDLDGMLTFWAGQSSKLTPQIEKTVAKIATGSEYGKDYNSKYQGKYLSDTPNVQAMLDFWLTQVSSPSFKKLSPGKYEVV